ncbi:MAG TPA: SDR family NAD(P)-dependent oxidoreductase [Steroidobacteraceae bacterium]
MKVKNEQFAGRYGPWAFIAGASEGIGRSFAMQLAERGINLLLVARRAGPLEETAAEIRGRFGVQVVAHALDLTADGLDPEIDRLVAGKEIGLLVYNAGATHGAGLLLDQPIEKALDLVRLNCVGPLVLVHKLGQQMKAQGRGGIILMSSLSGLAGGAFIATYAAAKSFEIVLAESLWYEFATIGVDVLGLIAGATLTPAMLRSGMKFGGPGDDAAQPPPDGPTTNIVPMDPDDVAREALEHLGHGPIWVAGETNRASAASLRSAPRNLVVEAMSAAVAQMYQLPLPERKRP